MSQTADALMPRIAGDNAVFRFPYRNRHLVHDRQVDFRTEAVVCFRRL